MNVNELIAGTAVDWECSSRPQSGLAARYAGDLAARIECGLWDAARRLGKNPIIGIEEDSALDFRESAARMLIDEAINHLLLADRRQGGFRDIFNSLDAVSFFSAWFPPPIALNDGGE